MKTNELKKGDRVLMLDGFYATMADNLKGNIRLATVEGPYCTELGSIYAHDIGWKIGADGARTEIEHTPAQKKLRERAEADLW